MCIHDNSLICMELILADPFYIIIIIILLLKQTNCILSVYMICKIFMLFIGMFVSVSIFLFNLLYHSTQYIIMICKNLYVHM